MVELASRRPGGFSTPRLRAVASYGAQPGANARPGKAGQARSRGDRSRIPPALRRGPSRARRSTNSPEDWWNNHRRNCPTSASPTFPPSSLCINRCRYTQAAWVCCAGDHCKEAATLAYRSSAWDSCTRKAIPSARLCRRLAGGKLRATELGGRAGRAATTPDGRPCITRRSLGERSVLVAVWRVRVGRVQLYLLDTDLEENAPWDRELSARSLWRGSRDANSTGNRAGHWRRSRAQVTRLPPGGISPERRPCGVRRAAADPRSHRAWLDVRRSPRGDSRDDDLHHPHASPRRPRAFPFHLVEKHLAGCWGTLGRHRDRFLALGSHEAGSGSHST